VSWAAGLILLITAPLIPLFMVLVGMGAENISQRHFQSLARMSAHFLDTLQGLATLKIFDRSKKETENVAKVSAAYRRKTMAVLRVAFLSSAVLEFFSAMAIAIVAVYLGLGFLGYYQFGTYGVPLTFQQGFFILLLAPEFYSPLKELGAYYHARASAIGAAEEILKILRIRPGQVEDHGKEIILPSKSSVSIQFKDVSVDFGRGRRGLEGVTLKIEAGQKVAIVGPSGAGKSTLIHLLLGFVQPSSGQILIDAFPQSKLSIVRWRKQLAWIGQHPILFPGSILENIRMAAPFADTKEVFKAASAAGVMAFCDHLPGGVETVLGEQGLGLSKGQAQRVALARAYLKNSPLLLLDEPTAGLDHITEQQILKSAVSIFKGRTVLMVTHNETATVRMDRIVRMEQGHVTEII
jgi:ATP-binding cassette subfamily C protein CydD